MPIGPIGDPEKIDRKKSIKEPFAATRVYHGRPVYKRDSKPIDSLSTLQKILHDQTNYSFFGTVLADTSNDEIAGFMQNYQAEIDEITGKECCFLYFRDLVQASELKAFNYSEHPI